MSHIFCKNDPGLVENLNESHMYLTPADNPREKESSLRLVLLAMKVIANPMSVASQQIMPVKKGVKYLMPYISKIVCKGSYISFFGNTLIQVLCNCRFPLSLQLKMKYRDCRNKIITFILALFFLGYYARTTCVITNIVTMDGNLTFAPFFIRSHTHTNNQLQVIAFFICGRDVNPVTAGCQSRYNYLSSIFLNPVVFTVPVADRPVRNLRAPPVM